MRRSGLLALLVLAVVPPAHAAAPRPDPSSPLLVFRSRDVLAISAQGRVLRRLPCAGTRTLDGRRLLCRREAPGLLSEYSYAEVATGRVRPFFRETRETRFAEPKWSPSGTRVAGALTRYADFGWNPDDPALPAVTQASIGIVDVGTGELRAIAEGPRCDRRQPEVECSPQEFEIGTWAGEDRLLVRSERIAQGRRWALLDLRSGAIQTLPAVGSRPLVSPSQRRIAFVPARGNASLFDLGGRLVSRFRFTSSRALVTWSPNGRYLSNGPDGRFYDLVRRRVVNQRIGAWAPDSRHHAVPLGRPARIELRTRDGRRVRTLYRGQFRSLLWATPFIQ